MIKKSKLISLWWVIVEILGSIAGVLFFIETQSGIFNVTNYGFRIAMTLLCFILVPTAFALPIIIKKLKLLFIPSVIMPLVIVVYYLGEYSYMILFFCIALAFIGAFGAVAGFLIRSFRSGRSKAKIVKITVGILVLLTPVLFMSYVFAGFPLHSMPVNKIVREYVADTYSEFDITVSRTRYDWYDGKYVTTIHDRNDKDIYFEVWCITKPPLLNPSNIVDRYTYGEYWEKKIKKMITPLLEEDYGNELKYVSMGHELFGFYVTVGGVKIGQPFDKDAPVRIEGNFSVAVKDTEPSTLAAEFVKYRDFIEKNGFTFESYLFRFRGVGGLTVRIRAEYINDDLATLFEYMQSNLDERGSYYDGNRGLHYY